MSLYSENESFLVEDLNWDFPETNRQQDYATHTLFRYFGKLPPVVTRKIINYANLNQDDLVVDVMSGSGTTAVECALLGKKSYNIDANPLSIMIGRVKTRRYDTISLRSDLELIIKNFDYWRAYYSSSPMLKDPAASSKIPAISNIERRFPKIQNIDYWFSKETKRDLALLLISIEESASDYNLEFFKVCFASIIRKASNASSSTGRIFIDRDKSPKPPKLLFLKSCLSSLEKVAEYLDLVPDQCQEFCIGDARSTSLTSGTSSLSLFHPPYFALYRYSSDILRFELDWLGMSRTDIRSREIEDGFKTTKRELFDAYLNDLEAVFCELSRITKKEGLISYINNNSTLRDERLPVIDESIIRAENAGLKLVARSDRDVIHTQAVYHKSARTDKITKQDHILFFTKK